MKRRLRRGGCLAWRQTAFTVEVDVPTCRAIARADMPVGSRSSICCFFAALIGRQAMLRIPRAVVVSHTPAAGATLDTPDSGATSPAMRRLRKASRGSQLFELMLPRCREEYRRYSSVGRQRGVGVHHRAQQCHPALRVCV